jgi:hypothetical protein
MHDFRLPQQGRQTERTERLTGQTPLFRHLPQGREFPGQQQGVVPGPQQSAVQSESLPLATTHLAAAIEVQDAHQATKVLSGFEAARLRQTARSRARLSKN